MAFYENTLVVKQDLSQNELEKIKQKYNNLINDTSGKVIKVNSNTFYC